jgi:hypothetical protein
MCGLRTHKGVKLMANNVTTRCTVIGPATDVAAFRERMFIWDDRSEEFLNWGFHTMSQKLIRSFPPAFVKRVTEQGGHMRFDFERLIPSPALVWQVEESNTSEHGARLILLRGQYVDRTETMGMPKSSIKYYRADVSMPKAPMHEVAAAFLQNNPEYEVAGRARLQALLETGYSGWYSWTIANWGTKRNAYSYRPVSDKPLEFLFDTAWNFPWPVFETLAREFPTLQFKCLSFDEGWGFAGEGCFNPAAGERPFELCDATEELYERVYGKRSDGPPSRGLRIIETVVPQA